MGAFNTHYGQMLCTSVFFQCGILHLVADSGEPSALLMPHIRILVCTGPAMLPRLPR